MESRLGDFFKNAFARIYFCDIIEFSGGRLHFETKIGIDLMSKNIILNDPPHLSILPFPLNQRPFPGAGLYHRFMSRYLPSYQCPLSEDGLCPRRLRGGTFLSTCRGSTAPKGVFGVVTGRRENNMGALQHGKGFSFSQKDGNYDY